MSDRTSKPQFHRRQGGVGLVPECRRPGRCRLYVLDLLTRTDRVDSERFPFSAEMILSSLCLSILITSTVATPPLTSHDTPKQKPPFTLAPFHTLPAEHQDKVLNNSYIIIFKDDLHTSAIDSHFNFLQIAHEEDPLLTDGPVGISQIYDGHLKGYAGHFTEVVIQRIREMPEVAYIEQDSIVRAFETQRFAPWVRSQIPVLSRDCQLTLSSGPSASFPPGEARSEDFHPVRI